MTLSETMVFTHDFSASVEFYRDQLGWYALELEEWGWGLFEVPGGGKLGVLASTCWTDESGDGSLPRPRMAFKTEDIDAEVARLASLGVEVSPVSGEPGEVRSAHFLDNQGNRFFLWSEGTAVSE